jgi:hypothetical protein
MMGWSVNKEMKNVWQEQAVAKCEIVHFSHIYKKKLRATLHVSHTADSASVEIKNRIHPNASQTWHHSGRNPPSISVRSRISYLCASPANRSDVTFREHLKWQTVVRCPAVQMSGGYNHAAEQAATETIAICNSASDVTRSIVQSDSGPSKHNKYYTLQKQSIVCTDCTYRYFIGISRNTEVKQSTSVSLHIRCAQPEV